MAAYHTDITHYIIHWFIWCAFHSVQSSLLCFLPCSVGSDAHPRSSLHGSPEHRPAPAAERGLGWRQQYCEWCETGQMQQFVKSDKHSVTVRFSECALTRLSHMLSFAQRGETALHMAARAGQVEVVRCLLRNGAMVDARARVRLLQSHLHTW